MNQVNRREERKCEGVGVEWINRGSDAFRVGGSQGNVHESFWFYCTFSIILRNSGKEKTDGIVLLRWKVSVTMVIISSNLNYLNKLQNELYPTRSVFLMSSSACLFFFK